MIYIIININNCIQINAIVIYLIIAYRKTTIKSVEPIITGAVRTDKEALLYRMHSVFRPLLLLMFPAVKYTKYIIITQKATKINKFIFTDMCNVKFKFLIVKKKKMKTHDPY